MIQKREDKGFIERKASKETLTSMQKSHPFYPLI